MCVGAMGGEKWWSGREGGNSMLLVEQTLPWREEGWYRRLCWGGLEKCGAALQGSGGGL